MSPSNAAWACSHVDSSCTTPEKEKKKKKPSQAKKPHFIFSPSDNASLSQISQSLMLRWTEIKGPFILLMPKRFFISSRTDTYNVASWKKQTPWRKSKPQTRKLYTRWYHFRIINRRERKTQPFAWASKNKQGPRSFFCGPSLRMSEGGKETKIVIESR